MKKNDNQATSQKQNVVAIEQKNRLVAQSNN